MVSPQRLTPATPRVRQQTPEERDNELRGDPLYSDRCRYWESLTDEDIWGGPAPHVPAPKRTEADDA